ncbi:glycosyltransferase family 2 protein [Cyclobacterium qasimii]|uniref:RfbQ n=2 Tax=Cyclobacterium qasimii TaxID=1350429 RepID=S7WTP4_9BACT|nr:glycosyltransferase [Cyclobacterium qasimii]EPR67473.1 RfbQ [Cyclobacterium qasimii M12-11B]GEO21780.1 rhamnosyltransferase [Cyclobacterium qasimii]
MIKKDLGNSEENEIIVSVVIPTYRDWNRLSLCLLALEKQSFPSRNFEVIIINNDPNDPVPNDLPINGWVMLAEGKPGSYAARNAGIATAKGSILAFTDSDCIPDKDWLLEGLKELERSGTSRVGGKIDLFQPMNGSQSAFIYEKYFAFQQERNVKVFKKSVTGNFFAEKFLFDKYGAFDEGLMSGGDFFWNLKVSEKGEKIGFAELAIINHPSRNSIKKITSKKKRTITGYYKETYSKLKYGKQFLVLFKRLIPPMFRIRYIKFESTSDYFQVLMIRWYVELVGVKHLVELQWADKNNKTKQNCV